jgi:hypothetical protein
MSVLVQNPISEPQSLAYLPEDDIVLRHVRAPPTNDKQQDFDTKIDEISIQKVLGQSPSHCVYETLILFLVG